MAVPFHRLDKNGDQRLQAFSADPVRSFPQQKERFAHIIVIDPSLQARPLRGGLTAAEHPHGVLAMKSRHSNKFIQDPRFLLLKLSLAFGTNPKRPIVRPWLTPERILPRT